LDTYWVKHGGEDPVAYIKKLSGRCPILHLKDMADDAERSFAEVGEGILDFPAIFAAGEKAGAVWAMVEQDICPGDPLDSIRTSLANLRKMGYA
jgi:sugar phosphate isomerase/epimerase